MIIGKIVKSYSHIIYMCQIYGPLEIEVPPDIADYAFGHFVRVAVPSKRSDLSRNGQVLTTVYTRAGIELTDPQEGCKLKDIQITSSGEQPCLGVRQC